jgi:hypothetical protein
MVRFDPKDPSDVSDFSLTWDSPLAGDTIASVDSVTITPRTASPLIEDEAQRSNTTTTTTVWLSGGRAGSNYTLTIRVTTAGGRTLERSARVRVRDL